MGGINIKGMKFAVPLAVLLVLLSSIPCASACTNDGKISIDVKPGSDPNSINCKSNGVVTIAVDGNSWFYGHQLCPADVKDLCVYVYRDGSPCVKLPSSQVCLLTCEDVIGCPCPDPIIKLKKNEYINNILYELNCEDAYLKVVFQVDGTTHYGIDSIRIVPANVKPPKACK